MLGKLWRRFFRREEDVPRVEALDHLERTLHSAKVRRVEPPVPTSEPGKVSLILDDGTVVSPPSDTELDEKFRYLTDNLIPGVGNPTNGDANEG